MAPSVNSHIGTVPSLLRSVLWLVEGDGSRGDARAGCGAGEGGRWRVLGVRSVHSAAG